MNIWKDCEQVPLTSLLSFIVDNRGKTVPVIDDKNGIKLIATNCIKNENLYPVYEKVRFLSEETYKTWFRAHPQPGDIIFVNKGTPGKVAFVPDPIDFCIAQDMMAFRVNPEIVYNKYLFAVLRSAKIQEQIRITSVGDVIPHFKKEFLDEIKIPLPDLKIQKYLGDMYFIYSEKIELNNKINTNLEHQAQALFKNFSEKSSKSVKFTDLIYILGGGTPKTNNEDYWNGKIPFFTPKDVGNPYCLLTEKKITESGLENCNSSLYPVNTIFVTARGTVGKVCLAGLPMAMNQSCYALKSKDDNQLLAYFYTLEAINSLKHKANGATFDAIVTRDFETETINVLSEQDTKEFTQIVKPIFEMILTNQKENINLSNLRDTLLPKLMNGELGI